MIKPAYSVSFLLSINIFVWQNVLYFLDASHIIVYFTPICSHRWRGCGGRGYKSPKAHCTLLLLDSRPVNFAAFCGLFRRQFLSRISRCCLVSGVFRLWCWCGRHHSWSGAPVSDGTAMSSIRLYASIISCLRQCAKRRFSRSAFYRR